MDAVDAALLDIDEEGLSLVATRAHPIPRALRSDLSLLIGHPQPPASLVWQLDQRTGELFAEAALSLMGNAGAAAADVCAIGSHGQTVAHHPDAPCPHTVQIGDPNVIAERTRITTVADFRRRDLAAGGQGAPLACAFHVAALARPQRLRLIINVGGIANISVLPPEGEVIGFDCGPGNTLMDTWTARHLGVDMDRDGAWASSGRADEALLARLCSDSFFAVPPPKSTGREYFNLDWLDGHLKAEPRTMLPGDVQRTLCALSVETISRAIERFAGPACEVLVCGGGARNPMLMRSLRERLPSMSVETTATAGIDPDWVEAAAFAWLARQTLSGLPGNLPGVTGARRPVVLGAIHPA